MDKIWHKAEDRLPCTDKLVLACSSPHEEDPYIAYYSAEDGQWSEADGTPRNGRCRGDQILHEVTHWMPLPHEPAE